MDLYGVISGVFHADFISILRTIECLADLSRQFFMVIGFTKQFGRARNAVLAGHGLGGVA